MSALSYEGQANIPRWLDYFFPGWYVKHTKSGGIVTTPTIEKNESDSDWTTFYEFSSADNRTSVIAVRGTAEVLDVLNDVNIWMAALLMQGFGLVGPVLTTQVAQAVSKWSSIVAGSGGQVGPRRYFHTLLTYARERVAKDGNRTTFYITGHSLGGGLAKIIASEVDIQAVTWMAPGLAMTSSVVFDNSKDQMSQVEDILWNLRDRALTVQPQNDIISRGDHQTGTVIPTHCARDPLFCHSVFTGGICPLWHTCGSMRDPAGPPLIMPCGFCPEHPC